MNFNKSILILLLTRIIIIGRFVKMKTERNKKRNKIKKSLLQIYFLIPLLMSNHNKQLRVSRKRNCELPPSIWVEGLMQEKILLCRAPPLLVNSQCLIVDSTSLPILHKRWTIQKWLLRNVEFIGSFFQSRPLIGKLR